MTTSTATRVLCAAALFCSAACYQLPADDRSTAARDDVGAIGTSGVANNNSATSTVDVADLMSRPAEYFRIAVAPREVIR